MDSDPNEQKAKGKRSLWRYFPLFFSIFYLTSFGPAVYLAAKFRHAAEWVEPVFIPVYALHIWAMKGSEAYYEYGMWWVDLARPQFKKEKWEDWRDSF